MLQTHTIFLTAHWYLIFGLFCPSFWPLNESIIIVGYWRRVVKMATFISRSFWKKWRHHR